MSEQQFEALLQQLYMTDEYYLSLYIKLFCNTKILSQRNLLKWGRTLKKRRSTNLGGNPSLPHKHYK